MSQTISQHWLVSRSKRKSPHKVVVLLFSIVMLLPLPAISVAEGAEVEPIIFDHRSSLALYGFDPVAYFSDAKASKGVRKFELEWRGLVWRFANLGNMEAFRRHPQVYAPKFGGYGALSVARGFSAQGSPYHWAIYGRQLYFFHTPAHRIAWLNNPTDHLRRAKRRWPEIKGLLAHSSSK